MVNSCGVMYCKNNKNKRCTNIEDIKKGCTLTNIVGIDPLEIYEAFKKDRRNGNERRKKIVRRNR